MGGWEWIERVSLGAKFTQLTDIKITTWYEQYWITDQTCWCGFFSLSTPISILMLFLHHDFRAVTMLSACWMSNSYVIYVLYNYYFFSLISKHASHYQCPDIENMNVQDTNKSFGCSLPSNQMQWISWFVTILSIFIPTFNPSHFLFSVFPICAFTYELKNVHCTLSHTRQ